MESASNSFIFNLKAFNDKLNIKRIWHRKHKGEYLLAITLLHDKRMAADQELPLYEGVLMKEPTGDQSLTSPSSC